MTSPQTKREEAQASVQTRTETGRKSSVSADPIREYAQTGAEFVLWLSTDAEGIGNGFVASSSEAPNDEGAVAPDHDLTADEWELAKAAVMKAVANRLDKPDDFLADIRARIANI